MQGVAHEAADNGRPEAFGADQGNVPGMPPGGLSKAARVGRRYVDEPSTRMFVRHGVDTVEVESPPRRGMDETTVRSIREVGVRGSGPLRLGSGGLALPNVDDLPPLRLRWCGP
jgi:hypothetical protein